MFIDIISVKNSSQINSIAYDIKNKRLAIKFKKDSYLYDDIDIATLTSFLVESKNLNSIGKGFNAVIKKGVYNFTKIGEVKITKNPFILDNKSIGLFDINKFIKSVGGISDISSFSVSLFSQIEEGEICF